MQAWGAHVLRGIILITAIAVLARGDVLYGIFCLGALGVTLVPTLLARFARIEAPLGLELVLLLLMVADMTLGNLLGLYTRLPWYDKALHLGFSLLVGLIAFLSIYMVHAVGRGHRHPWLDGLAILLLTLGIGAVWELGEYAVDRWLGRSAQGAPGMSPLDDTMIDLLLDGVGGALAAVLGALHMRRSARDRRRARELVAVVSRRLAPARFSTRPPIEGKVRA